MSSVVLDFLSRPRSLVDYTAAVLLTGVAIILGNAIYALYLHPLSRFPGPVSHAVSRLPFGYQYLTGTLPFDVLKLHERYGDIVRVAPDELSIAHPDAWKQVMGYGAKEMEKGRWFFRPEPNAPTTVVNAEGDTAKRLRRTLGHGFSEKAMRDQESLITRHVDVFIRKLHEMSVASAATPVILSDWYNYLTFDIIGDLAFGEPFGYLEDPDSRAWFTTMFESFRFVAVVQMLSFFPLIKAIVIRLLTIGVSQTAYVEQKQNALEKMTRRMELEHERPDLIEKLIKNKSELNLSMDDLVANGESLIVGGSETTATVLSGLTYYLLTNPVAYEKLTEEIRTSFADESEINLVTVQKLSYTFACLDEAMRLYPPVAPGLPRVVPRGGAVVLGQHVPENTYISIYQWALYRRKEFFTDALQFRPERFLKDTRFAGDRLNGVQPFHIGPRDCLGRALAYGEMRLVVARLLFNFDMKIEEKSRDWIHQKNYLLWQKGPLGVHLTPVTR